MSVLRSFTTGHRKLIVYILALVFLLVGLVLALVWPEAGLALYGIYVGGIAGAATIFTAGNAKEHPPKETP